jgi:glucan-binding YG repeat protein
MALVEKDLELLDDYLSNRMSDSDRQAFEQKLEADPELKKEMQIQQSLIESIRQARIAELKTMLNSIPVTSITGGQTALFTKVISSVAVVGLVSTAVYFYFDNTEETREFTAITEQTEQAETTETEETPEPEDTPQETPVTPEPDNTQSKEKPVTEKKPAPATESKPKLDLFTPEEEVANDPELQHEREQLAIISEAFVTSSIEVVTDNNNKKYSFHYLFRNGKLVLFGAFEENLYEILEFIARDKRTVFLYYKSSYYLLDLTKDTPTELVAIRDPRLIQKLKEHRAD